MTTNQTIDGVPRELLEVFAGPRNYTPEQMREAMNELRALLDAPAQTRGEPVAWKTGPITWAYEPDARRHGDQHGVIVVPLYAEPPAPVAVVLPERKSDPEEPNDFDRYDLGEVSTFSEFRGVVEGWNACLDELKRLNPSL